ncbi:MAG: hypothetical protein AVDCRST_MAG27-924 [uncultured Craurococcus sp.]|uniref:Uncharacterized protein n=1 Tax=uncultured Craurococcus sp. TaxID=1135998 RepID=A0A6J4HT34_9PROT|nr:MAG: hypothetical protein AVDCRST_MAG27-924 [uncultured Craurococcus sp.]
MRLFFAIPLIVLAMAVSLLAIIIERLGTAIMVIGFRIAGGNDELDSGKHRGISAKYGLRLNS